MCMSYPLQQETVKQNKPTSWWVFLSLLYPSLCNWFALGWFFNFTFWGWFAIMNTFLLIFFFLLNLWLPAGHSPDMQHHQTTFLFLPPLPPLVFSSLLRDISAIQNQRAKCIRSFFSKAVCLPTEDTKRNLQNFTIHCTDSQIPLQMCFLGDHMLVNMSG